MWDLSVDTKHERVNGNHSYFVNLEQRFVVNETWKSYTNYIKVISSKFQIVRDHRQIPFLILDELISLYFPGNHQKTWFPDHLRGNRSWLIHWSLFNIRSKNLVAIPYTVQKMKFSFKNLIWILRFQSYTNQSIYLHYMSIDWFLYDGGN